jgi:hypothetical protein
LVCFFGSLVHHPPKGGGVNRPERWFDLVRFELLSNRQAQYGFAGDLVRDWFDFGSKILTVFGSRFFSLFFSIFKPLKLANLRA